jgi:hypothetical protein
VSTKISNRINELVPEVTSAESDNGKQPEVRKIQVSPPLFKEISFHLVSTAPGVQCAFAAKTRDKIKEDQAKGKSSKNQKLRPRKNFAALYEASRHVSNEGWYGWPANAFRKALIATCRVTEQTMQIAKMTIFVKADGYEINGTPLVRIIKGTPRQFEMAARNSGPSKSIDIRSRAIWDYWECIVTVSYDSDQWNEEDIANLMLRAGIQNGIGEGRPNSRMSDGVGWGTWTFKEVENAAI